MPVNLKRIHVRNFETIKEATVDFPTSGLCLVVGHNRSKTSVESIGSGKTALGEAISRTLLGVRGRYKGAKLGAYSSDHNGNKDTLIELECELASKELKIWSAYRCKGFSATGESLRFSYDGKDTEHGNIDDTRRALNALIGIQPNVAESTVFIDGAKLNFNDLSETELVDLFLSSLSQTDWGEAQERAKATINETLSDQQFMTGQMESSQRMLIEAKETLADLQDTLPDLRKQLELCRSQRDAKITAAETKVKEAKERVSRAKTRMSETKAELKKLEAKKAEEFAQHELEVSRVRSQVSERSRELEGLNRAAGSAKRAYADAKSARTNLDEPTTCPTCGKPWDKRHAETALRRADDLVAESRRALDAAQTALVAKTVERDKLDAELAQLQEKMQTAGVAKKINELSDSYEKDELRLEDAADDVRDCERALARDSAPVDETPVKLVESKVAEAELRVQRLQGDVNDCTTKLTELTTTLSVLTYWHKAFGPTGLPNMILGDAMGFINHVSANISMALTGGLLEINYANTKTLASSAERPELTINVKNVTGAKRFLGSSKGEAGISNLIIAETLNEIGRAWQRVGYRWLDEAVNSQDRMIRGAVYGYARQQARSRGILTFVVDHNQDVEAFADHVLVAEKSPAGFTTYHWASETTI